MKELIAQLDTEAAASALSELTAAAKKQAARAELDALLGDRAGVKQLLLTAPEPKARKNAARLLGALGHAEDAAALADALSREQTRFVTPSILLALGSVGGEAAKEALAAYAVPQAQDETEEKHCREIAEAYRKALCAFEADKPLPVYAPAGECDVLLVAPEGFSDALCAELTELGYTPRGIAQGAIVRTNELQKLYRARCFSEALIPLGGRLPVTPEAVAKAGKPVLTLPWRVELRGYAGDRAAFIRAVNALLGGGDNPSHYALELRVHCRKKDCDVFLRVANQPDGRFSYRKRAIPASIAPATAACLARLAVSAWRGEPEGLEAAPGAAEKAERARPAANAKPHVLDPFCGSGTLLIELARRTPCASLTGVDIAPSALSAARINAASAHTPILLLQKDALRFEVRAPYDIVMANLPFGNRVGTHEDNEPLYRAFVRRLPELLADSGVAVLYTMERRLLAQCVQNTPGLTLVTSLRTEAGGLLPWAFVLRKA